MIDILFKEYDTLRQEIIARSNQRAALPGIFLTAIAFAIVQINWQGNYLLSTGLIAFIFGVLFLYLWRSGRLIARLGRHVANIEKRINKIAGEELLRWETKVASRSTLHGLYLRHRDETETPD